jgi:hypothetical protein
MDLAGLTAELRELVELVSPATMPIPKLKRGFKHAYDTGPEKSATMASRPSSLAKAADGDGTQAGVKPKSLGRDDTKTSAKPKGRDTKTQVTPGAAPKAGGGTKPSCPGGQEPRMVFGKWRCGAARSKGAAKAKSRIATKRKAKGKPKVKVGGLAKLVNKARAALAGLFT